MVSSVKHKQIPVGNYLSLAGPVQIAQLVTADSYPLTVCLYQVLNSHQ